MNDYEIVIRWLQSHGMDNVSIRQITYDWTPSSEFGHAWMRPDGIYYNAQIRLHPIVEGKGIFRKSVLWHEFVHLWDYYESGEMGHYKKFFKKLWSQPLYPIINLICALPMGILMVAYEVKHHGVEI